MRTGQENQNTKFLWPKVIRKLLNLSTANIRGTTEQVNGSKSNFIPREAPLPHTRRRRKSCSDKEDAVFIYPASGREEWLGCAGNRNRGRSDNSAAASSAGTHNLRIFVGTWNVGGKAPHAGLNLRDWLSTPAPADIYVLGFQEIVPLNAGNVLGTKDRIPAARWVSLIRQALNFPKTPSTTNSSDEFPKPRLSFSDLISIEKMLEADEIAAAADYDAVDNDSVDNDNDNAHEPTVNSSDEDSSSQIFCRRRGRIRSKGGYYLAVSKQMVGIFLCVWIYADLVPDVSRLKVSCVPRGVLGYMGNKGSISISMTLRSTTFCFVCTHLTSGEKEKDEVRRNSDVVEILKKTRFPRSQRWKALGCPALSPKSILKHQKVIWLGDLNYRLTTGCEETHELLERNDWDSLLEKDQLRIEQRAGRVFNGWEEGKIYFPPTYKYLANSDRYAVEAADNEKHKKRTPAWCDRILWRGEGIKQICYVRGESRFSDHRPVYSIFSVRVEEGYSVEEDKDEKDVRPQTTSTNTDKTRTSNRRPMMVSHKATTSNDSSASSSGSSCARVQAEEMFPITRTRSCLETSRL